MQNKHVIWGKVDPDEDVLVAVLLNDVAAKVELRIFRKKDLNLEQIKQICEQWTEGKAELDESLEHRLVERDMTEDSLLPDDIRADKPGAVRHIQNQWAFNLLASKLLKSFLDELEQLKVQAEAVSIYDRKLFDKAKDFWDRLLQHRKENNIGQDKLDEIKLEVNAIFDKLKTLRVDESKKFDEISKQLRAEFNAELAALKEELDKAKGSSKELWDRMKDQRMRILKSKTSKVDKKSLNDELDILFETIKSFRNDQFSAKLDKRISDLEKVVKKMTQSIDRDKNEYDFQQRRMGSDRANQLEIQLRQAKMNLITDKIRSKEEKLANIQHTLDDLKRKKAKEGASSAKPAEAKKEESNPKLDQKPEKEAASKPKQAKPQEKKADKKTDAAPEPETIEQVAKGGEAKVEAKESAAEAVVEESPEVAKEDVVESVDKAAADDAEPKAE